MVFIMPKVILFISCTIDGYIAREDGSVDFLDKFNKSGEDYGFNELINSIGTIVMGSKTFQQYSDHKQFYELKRRGRLSGRGKEAMD